MVKARTTNVLSNLILAFFLPVFCFGQQVSGALKGIVYDANGEPLIGAYVSLQDTDWRTVTDVDGVYAFAAIPAGEYTLIATYVGASDLETVVQVTGPVTEVDLRLEEDANVLAEAVVLAKTAAREQQERALQIESVELQKVVSRVKDVGEVIERLPGVNVRGSGSFGDRVDISLNGLNGTAVRTFIDGLPLEIVFPQFTINNIPVNSIARVDVYKGVVPIDVGSDALGGGVNVITEQRNVNELRASYGFGSFNTHQAAVSGNYTLSEGVSVGANVTYNYSDNNYTMNAFVFEDNERREIERFHDAYRLTFGSIHLDVRGKKWADRFRFTANANEYYKEVQNGGIIGNLAFGGTFYDGGGTAFSTLYEKKIGQKLTLTTNGAYSRTKVIFVDTTANVFSWSGNILTRRPNSPGELGRSSLSDRDFDNIANRTTLRWALTPRDEFLLSNLVANQSTIGRDEKRPIERDPLTRNQSLLKDVLGLQYQRKLFQDKLTFGVAGKLYYYNLAGVDANALTDVSISGTDYGYYASAKYDFNDRFFVRASFENALRIPTFVQFFGNGANIAANLTLKPETSDNLNVGASYASPRGNDLRFLLTLNGFTRSQNNLIFLNANVFPRNINADDVETIGGEGSLSLWFRDIFRLDVNATRIRQVYGEIRSLSQTESLEGTDFPNVPKWFYNTRLTYTNTELLGAGNQLAVYGQYKYVDQFNFLNVAGTFDPASFVPVQKRLDFGLNLSFQEGKYGVSLNANNILDAEVFDNFSVPRPGRNYNVRLSYRLDNFSFKK